MIRARAGARGRTPACRFWVPCTGTAAGPFGRSRRHLLETVRPAVDFDTLVDAGLVHRLVGDGLARCRAIVELHEKRPAERGAAGVGDEMAVADDALAEIFDVAVLLRQ